MRKRNEVITILLPEEWMGTDVQSLEVRGKMELPSNYLSKNKISVFQEIGWWICTVSATQFDMNIPSVIVLCDDLVIAQAAAAALRKMINDEDVPVLVAQ